MGHDLLQGDVGFAARGELRQVVGDLVHERQLAFLDQRPDGGGGQHLGLAEQQEQGFVGGRDRAAFGAGVAIGAEQPELAVAGEGDLRAGVAALGDVRLDQRVEVIERLGGKTECREVGFGKRIRGGHAGFPPAAVPRLRWVSVRTPMAEFTARPCFPRKLERRPRARRRAAAGHDDPFECLTS